MNIKDLKPNDLVYYAGSFYKFAEIKQFPHGQMIGIIDEPKTGHIDYLKPSSVFATYPCNCCIGNGCPVCSGWGILISPTSF